MISVDGVTARYGRRVALDRLSFSAGRGICALLGPNGAGKTTLMEAVMGLKHFEGSISVAGGSIRPGRFRAGRSAGGVGYLPQAFDLAGRLRVGETVGYAAWVNGRSRRDAPGLAEDALAMVGLSEKRRDRVKTLSGGERQRLGIACAIAHRPSILLLDEPTVGLDPTQRARLRRHLRLIGEEKGIILATHLLEDVHVVADRVVVINEGSVAFQGSAAEMAALGQTDRGDHESALECAYRTLLEAPVEG